jgi:hypothetical protein
MSAMAEIPVSLATFKAIEAARLSLAESHDDILRRVLNQSSQRLPRLVRDVARIAPPPVRKRGAVALTLFGQSSPQPNLKYAYLAALRSLVRHKPSLFEHLADNGTNRRRWAARSARELFPAAPHLARDHGHEIQPGWWVDTNISRAQIDARLAVACKIAGYRFGEDVVLRA